MKLSLVFPMVALLGCSATVTPKTANSGKRSLVRESITVPADTVDIHCDLNNQSNCFQTASVVCSPDWDDPNKQHLKPGKWHLITQDVTSYPAITQHEWGWEFLVICEK